MIGTDRSSVARYGGVGELMCEESQGTDMRESAVLFAYVQKRAEFRETEFTKRIDLIGGEKGFETAIEHSGTAGTKHKCLKFAGFIHITKVVLHATFQVNITVFKHILLNFGS